MQGLGASIQRAEWGMLTQCAEAGDIDPARAAQAGVLTQRAQALTQHAQALTQRARSEAPMQRAGASTQHAGARGVDAGRGADAGPAGGGSLNTDSLLGRGMASGTHPLAFEARVG